jgi:hypothetical protein
MGGQAGRFLRVFEPKPLHVQPIKTSRRKTVIAFELVGLGLFALFFGALITNKESISR